MTLVCSPHQSMPSDVFGSGLEILTPHLTMNPHHFPDSNWTHQSPFLFPSYEGKPQAPSYTRPQDVLPSSVPEYHQPAYPTSHRPPPIQVASSSNLAAQISRPKSSPSTFGPNVEDLFSNNPFKAKNDEFPPAMFALSPHTGQISGSTLTSPYYPPSEFPTPNPTHSPNLARPVPIAPDPSGMNNMRSMKRAREDDETSDLGQKRRKRAPSQSGPIELSGEEQLLLRLKEEENLPWKDIAVRFQTDLGKTFQVPALQMRFKRLRERMRSWTENDVRSSRPVKSIRLMCRTRYTHLSKHTNIGKNSSTTLLLQRFV